MSATVVEIELVFNSPFSKCLDHASTLPCSLVCWPGTVDHTNRRGQSVVTWAWIGQLTINRMQFFEEGVLFVTQLGFLFTPQAWHRCLHICRAARELRAHITKEKTKWVERRCESLRLAVNIVQSSLQHFWPSLCADQQQFDATQICFQNLCGRVWHRFARLLDRETVSCSSPHPAATEGAQLQFEPRLHLTNRWCLHSAGCWVANAEANSVQCGTCVSGEIRVPLKAGELRERPTWFGDPVFRVPRQIVTDVELVHFLD